MNNDWLDIAKKRLESESSQARNIRVERLHEQGLIDDQGEVTGQLRRWNAFLAIVAVRHAPGRPQIQTFQCLKPVFGMPGSATIDVCRESMVAYLREGKTVITATRDDRLDLWKEGCQVHLTAQGAIRCDGADKVEDSVGSLPEFVQSSSLL